MRPKHFNCLNFYFQIKITNDYVQQYTGPPKPVDFILVGHVMNYVVDEFIPTVDKMLSWLSPGGCLVLSHINPSNFFLEIGRLLLVARVSVSYTVSWKTSSSSTGLKLLFIFRLMIFRENIARKRNEISKFCSAKGQMQREAEE